MGRTASWLKGKLANGQFKVSLHAAEPMEERLITKFDIISCGKTAKQLAFQEENTPKRLSLKLESAA